jgi:hypothetical protein
MFDAPSSNKIRRISLNTKLEKKFDEKNVSEYWMSDLKEWLVIEHIYWMD